MLQLVNNTPFAAAIAVLPDEAGIDALYVNVRATFAIGQQWTLADDQPPPQAEDTYWGEPGESSLKYASDIHLGKPATDVVLIGEACAPDRINTPELDVNVAVGSLRKTIRVYGDRVWSRGRPTAPEPFQSMPIVYEKAFGGIRANEGRVIASEVRNPTGLGFAGGRNVREMEGLRLPNLEDPRQLIQDPADTPEPACFGARAPNWQPRVDHAGTFDAHWQETRAPFVPLDFDSRFNNSAHPDLIAPGFLVGGEPVAITNMHPAGPLQFNLPYIKMSVRVTAGKLDENLGLNLETVLLEPNRLQLSLQWKAKYPCDKRALKIRQVSLNLSR